MRSSVSQTCKTLCDLVDILLVHGRIALLRIRFGQSDLAEVHGMSLCSKGIAGACAVQLCDGADITCMKLGNFDGLGAADDMQLAELFFLVLRDIVQNIVVLDNAGADLDQRIFAEERICDGLEDLRGFGLLEIVVGIEGVVAVFIQTGAFAARDGSGK